MINFTISNFMKDFDDSFTAEQIIPSPTCFNSLGKAIEDVKLRTETRNAISDEIDKDIQNAYGAMYYRYLEENKDSIIKEAVRTLEKVAENDEDGTVATWLNTEDEANRRYDESLKTWKPYKGKKASRFSLMFVVALNYVSLPIGKCPELVTVYTKAKEASKYIDACKSVPDSLMREFKTAINDAVNVVFDLGITVNETPVKWYCNKVPANVVERIKISALDAIKAKNAKYTKKGGYKYGGTVTRTPSFEQFVRSFMLILLNWQGLNVDEKTVSIVSTNDFLK